MALIGNFRATVPAAADLEPAQVVFFKDPTSKEVSVLAHNDEGTPAVVNVRGDRGVARLLGRVWWPHNTDIAEGESAVPVAVGTLGAAFTGAGALRVTFDPAAAYTVPPATFYVVPNVADFYEGTGAERAYLQFTANGGGASAGAAVYADFAVKYLDNDADVPTTATPKGDVWFTVYGVY